RPIDTGLRPALVPTRTPADPPAPQPTPTTSRDGIVRRGHERDTFDGGVAGKCPVDLNSPMYQDALGLERQLSQARQDLGKLEQQQDNKNVLQNGCDGLFGDGGLGKKIDAAMKMVADLKKQEEHQPTPYIQAARFQVFR